MLELMRTKKACIEALLKRVNRGEIAWKYGARAWLCCIAR